ncbi:hypothetical protein GH742_10735 [Legionella sp. MW5194]|uniref:hypothetical protein n=1 Tax=Legionella sp. MW5194 TaxID=2662448 RepID=UPI00193D2566|nr:hypothetical protein [Legionella sp. MW5194]QRN04316.1 hypothetical protein GH742_10735 [Legionella sp. MW5194]
MEVPSYGIMQKATQKLIGSFNDLAKRYKPGSYQALLKVVKDELKGKYEENVKKKPQKKPRGLFSFTYFTNPATYFTNTTPDELRLNQIACITQLVTTLPEGKEEQETANYFGILLGSIIYRYLRLEMVYQGLSAMVSDSENCALKTTLAEVLKLNTDNALDELTVFECCSAYQRFLKQDKIADTFEYIKSDKDFFSKLSHIIAEYQTGSDIILKRIEYLQVIQNIDEVLTRLDSPTHLLFPPLIKELKAAMAEKQELSSAEIQEFWKKYAVNLKPQEAGLMERVMVFNRTIEKEELDSTDSKVSDFEHTLRKRWDIYKQHVLFGAYVTTLQKVNELSIAELNPLTKKMNTALAETISNALKIDASNRPDKANMQLGFMYMKHFLETPGIAEQITAKPWGRADILKGYVVTSHKALDEVDEMDEGMVLKV